MVRACISALVVVSLAALAGCSTSNAQMHSAAPSQTMVAQTDRSSWQLPEEFAFEGSAAPAAPVGNKSNLNAIEMKPNKQDKPAGQIHAAAY